MNCTRFDHLIWDGSHHPAKPLAVDFSGRPDRLYAKPDRSANREDREHNNLRHQERGPRLAIDLSRDSLDYSK